MARQLSALLLSTVAALASVAAAPRQDEMESLTAAFDAVLTGMAYVGVGLCFFGIVWAGFLLMAEGAEGEGRGSRARNAVVMAIVGLVVVLLAKGIAAGIVGRIIEVLPGA